MENNNEAIVNSATATILYWQVEAITPDNIAYIPDWVLGFMRTIPAKITMQSEFDIITMTLGWHAIYQTGLGTKKCHAGDFLILDRSALYSVTAQEFAERYTPKNAVPETRPELIPEEPEDPKDTSENVVVPEYPEGESNDNLEEGVK